MSLTEGYSLFSWSCLIKFPSFRFSIEQFSRNGYVALQSWLDQFFTSKPHIQKWDTKLLGDNRKQWRRTCPYQLMYFVYLLVYILHRPSKDILYINYDYQIILRNNSLHIIACVSCSTFATPKQTPSSSKNTRDDTRPRLITVPD